MQGKIFRKINGSIIKFETYDPNLNEYYKLINEQRKNGYQQFILTSEYMISLLEAYCCIRDFRIIKITFMEDDQTLDSDIDYYLENIRQNKQVFYNLKQKLEFINSESSIDIKTISLMGKSLIDDNSEVKMTLSVNGTFSIDEEFFQSEALSLLSNIQGMI